MERMEDGMWRAVYLGHRTHATQSVEFAWSSKVVGLCVFVFFFPSLFLKLVKKPNKSLEKGRKKEHFLIQRCWSNGHLVAERPGWTS